MKKIIKSVITGVLLLGLVFLASRVEWVREAWGQAKTVMYRDSQQTVTVPHIYTMPTEGPPLTVTGPGVGIPATGFAADMIGGSVLASLGPPTPAGKVRRLTDGAAAGALVVSDGTKWECAAAGALKIRIVTCPPYNAKGDGVTDDSPAFMAAIGTGNANIVIPPGTYIVWNLIWQNNTKITGSGVGITTLKLPDNKKSGIIANYPGLEVHDIELSHITFDGNGQNNNTSPAYAVVGLNGATNFFFHHLVVKNGIEYCMGLEGGTIQGKVSDVVIGPCRWDGIDIKNVHNNTRVELSNISVNGPGTAMGATPSQPNSVCVDSGGRNRLVNIRCAGLTGTSYGVNFRRHQTEGVNCTVPFCEGGDGSSLSNFYISGDGLTTTAGAGSLIRDGYVQVSNGFIEGMGRGIYVESDPGAGNSEYVTITNVIVQRPLVSGFETDTTASRVAFSNCMVKDSQGSGIVLGSTFAKVLGGSITGSVVDGIIVKSTASNSKIMDSNIVSSTGAGIRIEAGALNTMINDNLLAGNTVAPIVDLSTGTIIRSNGGVRAANKGQVTMLSGDTSVVVNHGLNFEPIAADIQLTLLENPTTDIGLFWVDAASITPTQFTIRCRTAPGASNLDIAWLVNQGSVS